MEVQVRDGSWWEGVLHSCSVDNKFEIILKCARKKLKNDQQNILNFQSIQNIPLFETISISPNQFVQLLAKNINFVDDVTRLSSNSLSSSSDGFSFYIIFIIIIYFLFYFIIIIIIIIRLI